MMELANYNRVINIDAVDSPLDSLASYRSLFGGAEPRFTRTIMVKDKEITDHSVLQSEVEFIKNYFLERNMVENEDFFIRSYVNNTAESIHIIYGKGFAAELTHYEYQPNEHFTFAISMSDEQYNNNTMLGIIDYYEKRIGKDFKEHIFKIYVINKTENGLNLVNFPIRKNASQDLGIEFSDLYNDDFYPKSERIIKFLTMDADKRTNNGIIVLQGKYGTGKTNYLRHLIRNVNKKIIFLPPELSLELANPGFVTFFMDHPDSILIIEDSETVLKTREAGGNQAVANLLNMSDGILGDALSLQIICTLNAEMEHIDKALLREGRLVEMHEFNELSEEKTEKLFKKLYGDDAVPPVKEMTLSQIFKCEDFERRKEESPEKLKFGFV